MADSGIAALDSWIARLKVLGDEKTVASKVATVAAPLVQAELQKTASAGTTPEGKAWKPKKDGGRPLVNAAAAISTRAAGNFVVTTLSGPTVFHHKGLQGKPVRQVIPDTGTVPPAIEEALVKAAKQVWEEITTGGNR
jgi:hypothetical protein